MKRFKKYLLDVYLILLDMDDHAKRQMIMEWIIAVFLLVFGSVWGGQWLFMAVVVLLYVIVDIYEAFHYGIMDVEEVSGTVIHVKRVITGRRIWLLTKGGIEKEFTIAYGTVNARIRTGDRVIFFGYPLEEEGQIKIIDYRIYHTNRKQKIRP